MPIIGFSIKKIEASRDAEPQSSLKANSTPKITDVKEIDIASLGQKALVISFEFKTEYEPDIGKISISGDVLYMAANNKEILEQWKSKETMPDEAYLEVVNALFRRCLVKALNLADDLQLPTPIQLPFIRPKELEGKKEKK